MLATTAAPLTALTCGVILDRMSKQINTAIRTASEESSAVALDLGQQLSFAIEDAKMAYQDSMNQTLGKVDQVAQRHIQTLHGLVLTFEERLSPNLQNMAGQIQNLVDALPLTDKTPRFSRVTPQLLAPVPSGTDCVIECLGKFSNIGRGDASLCLAGHEYTAFDTVTKLQFRIPMKDLPTPENDRVTLFEAKLNITSPWLLFWKTSLASHRVLLGRLPSTPGKIELICTTIDLQRVERTFTSQRFWQCSAKSVTHRDISKPYQVRPSAGWKIVPGTCNFQTIRIQRRNRQTPKGEWSKTLTSQDEHSVVYRVDTKYKGHKKSGDVTFTVSFTEWQNQESPKEECKELKLTWGESEVISIPSGIYKVRFTAFDGTKSELSGADLSSRYISLQPKGQTVQVRVKEPHEISFV